MCMRVYVCMRVCVCVCMCMRVCVYAYACMCVMGLLLYIYRGVSSFRGSIAIVQFYCGYKIYPCWEVFVPIISYCVSTS